MIVVDTSVWIDYFNGVVTRETALLDALLGVEPIVIGDLILAEVLQGFGAEGDARKARTALDRLLFQPMVGRDVALASARNYRALRARGVTVRKTMGEATSRPSGINERHAACSSADSGSLDAQ